MLITVDTGGTKTLVAGFLADGTIKTQTKFPTPKNQTEYITALQAAVSQVTGDDTTDAIVLALPGTIRGGVALWCNNLGWKDYDAQAALEAAFPGVPILVENDANLAGLSEARQLDQPVARPLYVTISTGIGAGLVVDGKIDAGMKHSEVGRALVEYNGKAQEWESFASGGAIYRHHGQYARDITDPDIWQDVAYRISRGFLAVIPIIQPDTIIIGGSMGTYFGGYSQQLIDILVDELPPHIPCPPIIAAKHPEEAVIYGCYYYALDELAAK